MSSTTAIEIYTPLFALFLSDRDFWRSSNSLQLDETIARHVGRLFDREEIVGLVNNKHPMVPLSTMEAGFRLMLHASPIGVRSNRIRRVKKSPDSSVKF
jgi:hypothetical protein